MLIVCVCVFVHYVFVCLCFCVCVGVCVCVCVYPSACGVSVSSQQIESVMKRDSPLNHHCPSLSIFHHLSSLSLSFSPPLTPLPPSLSLLTVASLSTPWSRSTMMAPSTSPTWRRTLRGRMTLSTRYDSSSHLPQSLSLILSRPSLSALLITLYIPLHVASP